MTQYFTIHPITPQKRLLRQVGEMLEANHVIVFPTDSGYAIGCALNNKAGCEQIRRIRQLSDKHHFTLVLQDLTQLGQYAIVHNTAVFRTIKSHIPGPYTFILQATKEVPRRLRQPKRKTIGLRVPEHPITQGILASLGAPLMSVTLIMPNETTPLTDPEVIYDRLKGQVALIVDGGYGDEQPTTIVDLTKDEPTIIREGKGDTTSF